MPNINLQFVLLCLTLVFLPAFEAPKTIFAILFMVAWLISANKTKFWGGPWRTVDTIFLAWLLAGITISLNATFVHEYPAKGIKDVLRYVIFGWVISRCCFSNKEIFYLILASSVSTLLCLFEAYYQCPEGGDCLELNSVGHVNHTVIFLLLSYTTALSIIITKFAQLNNWVRIFLSAVSLIFAYAIVDSHSRAATGLWAFMTLFAIFWIMWRYKNKFIIFASLIMICSATSAVIYHPPKVVHKFIKLMTSDELSARQKIRNFSYYAFKTNPVLGVGFGNFSRLQLVDIEDAVIADNHEFEQSNYLPYSHAHNVYYSTLVEGGLVLFSVFLLFWWQIIRILYNLIKNNAVESWLAFSASGVILINLGIGWVNTTLHHEHAMLSMFILGLIISRYRQVNQQSSQKL